MRIGMPRGIMFYRYFPFWHAFLEALDVELIASEPTNREILTLGLEAAESEFCLPLKVFYGHALSLAGSVDALLIPRLVSVKKREYTCPKMLGLPDLISVLEPAVPPVLAPTIDMRKGRRLLYEELYRFGRSFNNGPLAVLGAYRAGVAADREFQRKLQEGLTPPEALGEREPSTERHQLIIGLVGHPYNIYDSYITMNLVERLRGFGVRVAVPEHLEPEAIERESRELPKQLFWSYEKEIVGTAFHWLKKEAVHGVIYVLAFACGPDSFIQSIIEDEARERETVPVMSLVIDEHSSEAGLVTRLEAFIDMLKRRTESPSLGVSP